MNRSQRKVGQRVKIQSTGAVFRFLAEKCGAKGPVVCSLGSVDEAGVAAVRSVVLRGVDAGAGTVWISSDARAGKVRDLRGQPCSELVVWFGEERVQVRVRARWTVINQEAAAGSALLRALRERAWEVHSEASREMFFWPAPGKKVGDSRRRVRHLMLGEPAPHFVVLSGEAVFVDVLHIGMGGHRRYWHRRSRQVWTVERVNP